MLGSSIAVIGGGLVGFDVASVFCAKKMEVTVIEMEKCLMQGLIGTW